MSLMLGARAMKRNSLWKTAETTQRACCHFQILMEFQYDLQMGDQMLANPFPQVPESDSVKQFMPASVSHQKTLQSCIVMKTMQLIAELIFYNLISQLIYIVNMVASNMHRLTHSPTDLENMLNNSFY